MSFGKKQISWLCLNDQVICYVFFSQSVVINRLAAVHRGTLRALQVVTHQLSDLSHGKVPPYLKELGQLIRQLSLCSAKVEVEQGSAVPETALHILQKLEVRRTEVTKYLDGMSYPHLPARSLHSHTVSIMNGLGLGSHLIVDSKCVSCRHLFHFIHKLCNCSAHNINYCLWDIMYNI